MNAEAMADLNRFQRLSVSPKKYLPGVSLQAEYTTLYSKNPAK